MADDKRRALYEKLSNHPVLSERGENNFGTYEEFDKALDNPFNVKSAYDFLRSQGEDVGDLDTFSGSLSRGASQSVTKEPAQAPAPADAGQPASQTAEQPSVEVPPAKVEKPHSGETIVDKDVANEQWEGTDEDARRQIAEAARIADNIQREDENAKIQEQNRRIEKLNESSRRFNDYLAKHKDAEGNDTSMLERALSRYGDRYDAMLNRAWGVSSEEGMQDLFMEVMNSKSYRSEEERMADAAAIVNEMNARAEGGHAKSLGEVVVDEQLADLGKQNPSYANAVRESMNRWRNGEFDDSEPSPEIFIERKAIKYLDKALGEIAKSGAEGAVAGGKVNALLAPMGAGAGMLSKADLFNVGAAVRYAFNAYGDKEKWAGFVAAYAAKNNMDLKSAEEDVMRIIGERIQKHYAERFQPGSNLEYFGEYVLSQNFLAQIGKMVASWSGSDLFSTFDAGLGLYAQTHNTSGWDWATQIGAGITTFGVDAMTGGFLLPELAAGRGLALLGAGTSSGVRIAAESALGRVIGGMLNFGTYEAQMALIEQLTGAKPNWDNFLKGAGAVLYAGLTGGIKGAAFGGVGAGMNKVFRGTEGTTRVLGDVMTYVAEGSTFAAFGYIENGKDFSALDIGQSYGMALAPKLKGLRHPKQWLKDYSERVRNGKWQDKIRYHEITDEQYKLLQERGYETIADALKGRLLNITEKRHEMLVDEFEKLSADKDISLEVVRMADWVLNGKVGARPLWDDVIMSDDGLVITPIVKMQDKDGNIIERPAASSIVCKSEEEAQKVKAECLHQVEKDQYTKHMQLCKGAEAQRTIAAAANSYAEQAGQSGKGLAFYNMYKDACERLVAAHLEELVRSKTEGGKAKSVKAEEVLGEEELKVFNFVNEALKLGVVADHTPEDVLRLLEKRYGTNLKKVLSKRIYERSVLEQEFLDAWDDWMKDYANVEMHTFNDATFNRWVVGDNIGGERVAGDRQSGTRREEGDNREEDNTPKEEGNEDAQEGSEESEGRTYPDDTPIPVEGEPSNEAAPIKEEGARSNDGEPTTEQPIETPPPFNPEKPTETVEPEKPAEPEKPVVPVEPEPKEESKPEVIGDDEVIGGFTVGDMKEALRNDPTVGEVASVEGYFDDFTREDWENVARNMGGEESNGEPRTAEQSNEGSSEEIQRLGDYVRRHSTVNFDNDELSTRRAQEQADKDVESEDNPDNEPASETPTETPSETPSEPAEKPTDDDGGDDGGGKGGGMPMRKHGKNKDGSDKVSADYDKATAEQIVDYLLGRYDLAGGLSLVEQRINAINLGKVDENGVPVRGSRETKENFEKRLKNHARNSAKLSKWVEVRERLRAEAERRRQAQQDLESARVAAERGEQKAAERGGQNVGASALGQTAPGAVGEQVKAKWNGAEKVEGKQTSHKLPDGTKISGRYVVVESGAATPSHDYRRGFAPTEGFPVTENGSSVNDRDYTSSGARQVTLGMGENYDERALQGLVPVVTKDGVVVSGNGRTIAGDVAAERGTDREYVNGLLERLGDFGLEGERARIEAMKHPRVVLLLDGDMDYTTENFARFNQSETKKMNTADKAAELGKRVSDETFGRVITALTDVNFNSMSEFYSNGKAVNSLVSLLKNAGVIEETDDSIWYDRNQNILSAQGKELIEAVLIGKVFDRDSTLPKVLTQRPFMRQGVIMALSEIVKNAKLGGKSVEKELTDAISLVDQFYKDNIDGKETPGRGRMVSQNQQTEGLFGDVSGGAEAKNYSVFTLVLADLLNSGKPRALKEVLAEYNRLAEKNADESKQGNLFGEPTPEKSKSELMDEVLRSDKVRSLFTEEMEKRGEVKAENVDEARRILSDNGSTVYQKMAAAAVLRMAGEDVEMPEVRRREMGDADYSESSTPPPFRAPEEPADMGAMEVEAGRISEVLGVPIEVHTGPETVNNSQVAAELAAGKRVGGWFEKGNNGSRRLHLYLPGMRGDMTELRKTIVHEVVAHYGLEALLGEAGYRDICRGVFKDLSVSEKNRWLGYSGVSQSKDPRAAAGDEYIASVAERVLGGGKDVTDAELGLWRRFVSRFRELVRPFMERIGYRMEWTENDIAALVARSAKNLREGKAGSPQSGDGDGNRFRFIGSVGASAADAADGGDRMRNQGVAEDMERKGKDALSIKMATGWERGKDGKWRYEEADFDEVNTRGNMRWLEAHPDAKRLLELRKKVTARAFSGGEGLSAEEYSEMRSLEERYKYVNFERTLKNPDELTLEDFVRDERLFTAYPELKDVKVELVYDKESSERGSYSEKVNRSIRLNTYYLSDSREFKKTLAHEVQHAVQSIEGFDSGDNPSRREHFYDASLAEAMRQAHTYVHVHGENWLQSLRDDMKRGGYVWNHIGKDAQDVLIGIAGARSKMSVAEFDEAYKELWDKDVSHEQEIGYDRYRKNAGEVEARNVSRRMNMTDGQRGASLAEDTEDVPRDEQEVRTERGDGSELRYALVGGNKGYVGYSMSKRAQKAREEGRYPKTDFKRAYHLSDAALAALVKAGVVENTEWHHTSKFGNRTTFYGWREEWMPSAYEELRDKIDALAKSGGEPSEIVTLLEGSRAKTEYETYQSEQKRKFEEEKARLDAMRAKYEEEYPLAAQYDLGDGVVVNTNGSRGSYKWTVEKNGVRLSSRRGKSLRDTALEKARKILEPISFSEWLKEQGGSDLRFSVRDGVAPTFYSNAERAVEQVKQEKAKGEQWLAMLRKSGGIKAGEDKWMGLSDWLEEHKGETLTREQVLEFVRANGVKMEEVNYAENGDMYGVYQGVLEKYQNEFEDIFDDIRLRERGLDDEEILEMAFDEMISRHGEKFADAFNYEYSSWGGATLEPMTDRDGEISVEASSFLLGDDLEPINQTRLDYTTNGLKRNREIAFVVPGVEPYQEGDAVHFGPENKGRAVMWVRFGEATDADGKRVLVIDEVQSNRHQNARESGYKSEYSESPRKEYNDAVSAINAFSKAMKEKYGEFYLSDDLTPEENAEHARLCARLNETSDVKDEKTYDIPDAPFEKNWHEVVMKRMLRLAAEEGFDKVAWTTGEQQAERYNLSEQVSGIEVRRDGVNPRTGDAEPQNYNIYTYDRRGNLLIAASGQMSPEYIVEVFGKDLGERILAVPEGGKEMISGDGLRIGGEGMKAFYDGILPSFMKKYVKKWGSGVGEVKLTTPGGEVMHSVDVTDAMKRSVMEEGQTLFSVRGGERDEEYSAAVEKGDTKKVSEMVKEAAKSAMPETKVVDENGEPLVVYHGDRSKSKYVFGSNTFFSPSREYAGRYTYGTGEVKAYYLDIKRPFDIRDKRAYDIFTEYRRGHKPAETKSGAMDWAEYDYDDFQEYLKENYPGEFDGIVLDEGGDGGYGYDVKARGLSYVPFRPEQMKSADPVTRDNEGNIIPLSERFNFERQDVRYREDDDELLFSESGLYSNAESAVERVKQAKAKGEQWLAMLRNAGGIKAGEDRWMGLSEWLESHRGETLTKEHVLDFVRENGIRMEEVNYSGDAEQRKDDAIEQMREVLQEMFDGFVDESQEMDDTPYMENHYSYAAIRLSRELGWRDIEDAPFFVTGATVKIGASTDSDALRDLSQRLGVSRIVDIPKEEQISDTRLSYTTEGLKNKREIAFVVEGIEPYQESDSIHFGVENEGRAVMWVRFGETTDEDGNRVLVIDEVQSNRHQKGREKGYSKKYSKEEYDAVMAEYKAVSEKMKAKYGAGVMYNYDHWDEITPQDKEEIRAISEKHADATGRLLMQKPPEAPFEKNWHEVVMKRMLRLAAEEGFDKVAWTTGEQQAERYGIGGVVESITKGKTRGENTLVSVQYRNGKRDSWVVAPDGKVVEGGVTTGENLSDLIGKELSERVMSLEENGSISGDGLRIGGEGMKAFYDGILPSFMKKYVKKWGSGVGEVKLTTPGGEVMHSVDVTEAMKRSVMEEGQTLFSVRGGERDEEYSAAVEKGDTKKVSEMVKEAAKSAMPNTKVVDRWGKPRVVYHGTPVKDEFYEIDGDFYLTSNRSVANEYTHRRGLLTLSPEQTGRIMPCFVNLENPLVVDARRHLFRNIDVDWSSVPVSTDDIVKYAKQNGYDGVIIKQVRDNMFDDDPTASDVYVAFSSEQVKSAGPTYEQMKREHFPWDNYTELTNDVGATYDNDGKLIPLSERFNPEKKDTRFSVRDDINDVLGSGLAEAGRENEELKRERARANRAAATAARNATAAGASKMVSMGIRIRGAVAAQRKYDKGAAKIVTDLAQEFLDKGLLRGEKMLSGQISRLISRIKNSVGKENVSKDLLALTDLMINHQLREQSRDFAAMLKTKLTKKNDKGVITQGSVDDYTVDEMTSLRDAIERMSNGTLDSASLSGKIAEAQDAIDKADAEGDAFAKRRAEARQRGLLLAEEYDANVRRLVAEGADLRDEFNLNEEDRKALNKELKGLDDRLSRGEITQAEYDALKTDLQARIKDSLDKKKDLENLIRKNKVDQIGGYEMMTGKTGEDIEWGKAGASAWVEQQRKRAGEIRHNANSDLEGVSAAVHKDYSFVNRLSKVAFGKFSLSTFTELLRFFGRKSASGKGYLYERFSMQMMHAVRNYEQGLERGYKALDAKASELLGKKCKFTDWIDWVQKLPTITVSFVDGGIDANGKAMKEPRELSQGEAAYVYAMEKMDDGRMKLRAMGISDADVKLIADALDPKVVEMMDWLQGEYLPSQHGRYDEVHRRVFGAPLREVENYFHIRIVENETDKEVTSANGGAVNNPSGVTTGSIISRTHNVKSLDLRSDAFEVVVDELRKMEHWAAFSEMSRDLNTLCNYGRFEAKVKNMYSARFGSGKDIWQAFRECCQIVTGSYQQPKSIADDATLKLAKMVSTSKIAYRNVTALKQFASAPAFWFDARTDKLAIAYADALGSWNWAVENLPGFTLRWKGRTSGDYILEATPGKSRFDILKNRGVMSKLARVGLTPNAFVDALTVATGARAVYETKLSKYSSMGYSDAEAHERAMRDAYVAYNRTQQSAEGGFLSPMQGARTVWGNMLSIFRSASFGYGRRFYASLADLGRKMKTRPETMIAFAEKKLIRDGIEPAQARRIAEREYTLSYYHNIADVAMYGVILEFLWNAATSGLAYLTAGDDKDKKKEYINDAAMQAVVGGWAEGLPMGNKISESLFNIVKGDKTYFTDDYMLPAFTDTRKLLRQAFQGEREAEVAHEFARLLIASGTGVDPQTFGDVFAGVVDACNGDMDIAHETGLFMMRLMSVPRSQQEQFLIDNIGTARDRNTGELLDAESIAKRYARFRYWQTTGMFGMFTSDEYRREAEDRHVKNFMKKERERMELMSDEQLAEYASWADAENLRKDVYRRAGVDKAPSEKDSKANAAYKSMRVFDDIAEDAALYAERKRLTDMKIDERWHAAGGKFSNGAAVAKDKNTDMAKLEEVRKELGGDLDAYALLAFWSTKSSKLKEEMTKGDESARRAAMEDYRRRRSNIRKKVNAARSREKD